MTDAELIALAKKNLQADQDGWRDIYARARDDLFFLSDDECAQWDLRDYQARVKTGRPALTIDQLSQFVHQVANDIRMNTPSIEVIPATGGDVEVAEVYQGLIKNIEYKSNADDVYDTAALFSVKSSIGWIRIDHDYCDDDSFDQELLIKRVVNNLAIWIDCNSIECDGRDAKRGTVLDRMSVAEFKRMYPGKNPVSFVDDDSQQGLPGDTEDIIIAEVFMIEESKRKIAIDERGMPVEYTKKGNYKATRDITDRKVMRYKMSGADILEQTTFPGKYIPLIPVYGEEAWQDGKRHLFSLIRKSKGAQMMFNYWKSLETELLMKQPKAPIMVGEGQIEDYAEDWQNPDKAMALRYKTRDADGNQLPTPQRLDPPQIPTGIVNASRETIEDIKSTLGLYNSNLGAKSNAVSGKAINAQKLEGDVAVYHFGDNLVRSITQVGRVIVAAAPEIYDTPRVLRIIGEEDDIKEIGVNGMKIDEQEESIDLLKGKYDVRVVTGAPYTTRRQEAAQFYSDVVTRQPELMTIMGDLLFENSDFAGAQAMASRMKKVIDPKFLSEEEKAKQEEAPPIDPEKEQMAKLIQQGAQELQALQSEAEQAKARSEIEKALAQLKIEAANVAKAKAELQAQEQVMQAAFETKSMDLELQKRTAIDDIKSSMEPEAVAPAPAPSMPQGIKLDTTGFQFTKTPEQEQKDAMDEAAEAQREEEKLRLKSIELEQNALQTSAIIAAIEAIRGSVDTLTATIQAPKQVVYGKNGEIVGVR